MPADVNIYRLASSLITGDTFVRDGVTVTVLLPQEPALDLFGRDMIRYWCRRADTGAEGWMTFGPDGVVATEATP